MEWDHIQLNGKLKLKLKLPLLTSKLCSNFQLLIHRKRWILCGAFPQLRFRLFSLFTNAWQILVDFAHTQIHTHTAAHQIHISKFLATFSIEYKKRQFVVFVVVVVEYLLKIDVEWVIENSKIESERSNWVETRRGCVKYCTKAVPKLMLYYFYL